MLSLRRVFRCSREENSYLFWATVGGEANRCGD
jgi:hypothetical protein